jgi:hypothetical protein
MAFQEIARYFLGVAFQKITCLPLAKKVLRGVFIFCKPLKILTWARK